MKYIKGQSPWNKGKKGEVTLSLETRKKISESSKGRKHSAITKVGMSRRKGNQSPNWKGGKTPLLRLLRSSKEYRLWREAVFKRDNYTCIWCSARSGNGKAVALNADHIKRFADYPELRFAIDNGRTLCVPCHKTTDTMGGRKNLIVAGLII